jgi:hypothetical protein
MKWYPSGTKPTSSLGLKINQVRKQREEGSKQRKRLTENLDNII